MDWRQFLTGRRPREDVYETFPPENRTDYQPALLNTAEVLTAARVATRLLLVIAKRGGARVSTSGLEELVGILDEALPESGPPQCDDEAARVLDWLETAEQIPPDERDHETLPPELDLMLGADIEKRVSVAQLAIDEDLDLELEYFDEETNTWPRFRCEPLGVERTEEDEEFDPRLRVERRGETLKLPVRAIRWLMPVQHAVPEDAPTVREQLADVLDFPERRTEDSDDEDAEKHNDVTESPDDEEE